jgi:hypothetical protein
VFAPCLTATGCAAAGARRGRRSRSVSSPGPTRCPSNRGPFLLPNAGGTLRVVAQTLTDFTPHAFPAAGVSGLLEVTGLALWGGHLWAVMAGRARAAAPHPVRSLPMVSVS